MSQVIPPDICRRRESNENEMEETVKRLETKSFQVQHKSKLLKTKIEDLRHRNILLDKKIKCTESLNRNLQKDIFGIKTKTEELACSVEKIEWQIWKTDVLKEFENKGYERIINKQIFNQNLSKETPIATIRSSQSAQNPKDLTCNKKNKTDNDGVKKLQEMVNSLKENIKQSRNTIQTVDPKLYLDVQVLEKRNSALRLRYQRQLQETESRFRQSLAELASLQNILTEKNSLLVQNKH